MLKISDAVKQTINSNEAALFCLQSGYLNLSAYAVTIKPLIKSLTKKPVSKGSIVIALYRLKKSLKGVRNINTLVQINDLAVKFPLVEITYENTSKNLLLIKDLYNLDLSNPNNFLTFTQGNSEITIIANLDLKDKVIKVFGNKNIPKVVVKDLVALSVKFNENYLEEPNVIYSLIRILALKKINIVEIVSTYTELTFIIKKQDLNIAISLLNDTLS